MDKSIKSCHVGCMRALIGLLVVQGKSSCLHNFMILKLHTRLLRNKLCKLDLNTFCEDKKKK